MIRPGPALEASGRFEVRFRTAGLLAGPILALAVYLLHPGGHPEPARRLLALLVLAVSFWVTEAIPLPATALLVSGLAIVTGVAPAREVFQPYADPVIFLFVGSFLLAEAFAKYGLDRRVARALLGAHAGAWRRVTGIGGAAALVSCWLSNTATAAFMTPIAVGLSGTGDGDGAARRPGAAPDRPRATPLSAALLLMVAYGASIGGMATLVGTPPNLLTAGMIERMTGVKIGFAAWLLCGVPISLALFAASLFWVRVTTRGIGAAPAELNAAPAIADARDPVANPGGDAATRRGARLTIAAFALAGILWLLPAVAAAVLGAADPRAQRLGALLPESAVALLAAALLFVAPVSWTERRFALSWEEGARVNWGIILLFGGGLSLGTLAEHTGIARWIGEGLSGSPLARTPEGMLFTAIALTIVVSEFASNTAAATLLVPMVIAAAQAAGFDPIRPALGVGLAATCGFIFPVSTPPNAIVFGTGLLPLRRMIPPGLLLDLTAFVIIGIGLLLLTPILPH
jgi:sodium-dependent dicarboxylate transporter 2/3/5